MTPEQLKQELEKEFDTRQRLFLAKKLHSTVWNKWFSTALDRIAEAAVAQERERIVDEYGWFNDGCGCCSDSNLRDHLFPNKKEEYEHQHMSKGASDLLEQEHTCHDHSDFWDKHWSGKQELSDNNNGL